MSEVQPAQQPKPKNSRKTKAERNDLRRELASTISELGQSVTSLIGAARAYAAVEPAVEIETAVVALAGAVSNLDLARDVLRRKA